MSKFDDWFGVFYGVFVCAVILGGALLIVYEVRTAPIREAERYGKLTPYEKLLEKWGCNRKGDRF